MKRSTDFLSEIILTPQKVNLLMYEIHIHIRLEFFTHQHIFQNCKQNREFFRQKQKNRENLLPELCAKEFL